MTTEEATPIAVPPDRNLGAMVEVILAEAQSIRQGTAMRRVKDVDWSELTMSQITIHDTAQRLKVALEQREGVMEEMGKALEESRALIHAKLGYQSAGPTHGVLQRAKTALAKYEARHG